ncbi:ABC transporter permease [Rhodococcus sp. CX]|uniref:ABC transporter permease n=1 Tax=Rhodococcus sp. CX TaxID=2789880 RepID=UPI0018CE9E3D|nr:ABC transporter permease [Rhodococcus sp. CX]MBH0121183.1 ABC transporter permease [Rhodococcus sp. CX]
MMHLVLAQARAHRGRYIASALAVIVSVAFAVGTLVLGDTVNTSITKATAAQYEGVAAAAVLDHARGSEPDVAPEHTAAAAVPGVRAAVLDVTGYVRIVGAEGIPESARVTSLAPDDSLRWQRLADGRWPGGPGEVVVGSGSRYALGEALTVIASDAAASDAAASDAAPDLVTVVGTVDLDGTPQAMDSGLVFGETAQVRSWAGADAEVELRVAGDGDGLVDALAAALPGVHVVSGADRATEVAGANVGNISVLRDVLLCFVAIAVVVAGLVIANTFAVLLAARTRELALMRCVGVSAKQVRRSVRGEALVVGLVSATLGVLAGCGLAALVVALARAADVPIPLTSIAIGPITVVAGIVLGTVVTVVAASGPARRATRIPALAALHPIETQPEPVADSRMRRVCAALALVSGAALLVVGVAGANVMIACPGGVLVFVGVVLASRRLVPVAVGAVGRATGRFGGPVAALAAGNAVRNPRRTAATATALLIGITLTSTIVVGTGTLKAGAPGIVDDNFPVDAIVEAPSDGVPSGAAELFTGVEGVRAATETAAAKITVAGTEVAVTGVDTTTAATTVRADVRLPEPGTIVLEQSLADSLAAADGSTVTVTGPSGARELSVTATSAGEPSLIDLADLREVAGPVPADSVWLRFDDGMTDDALVAVTDEVTRVAATVVPGGEVAGVVAMRRMIEKVLDTMLLIVGGLLSVAVVIALIGVGNTMALSVLERRRETAMLRAIGLSRSGVRSLLMREALLVAAVASALGVTLGLLLGTAGTASVIGPGKIGFGGVPWLQLAGIVVAGGLAGVIASLIPALRASRVPPVAALGA